MTPFISVIIPSYNHVEFLPKRLESIFNQSFQNFEVIFLDDFSSDDSWNYFQKFSDDPKVSHCIRNEVNSGSPFKQWKKGIDLARGELIWIAESDDFCELNFLDEMISRLEENTSLIYCGTCYIDKSGLPTKGKFPNWNFRDNTERSRWLTDHSASGRSEILNYLTFTNTIVNASSVLFRKPKFFPEEVLSMRYCGDWYFWIYILQFGNVNFCSLRLNHFRIHDKSYQKIRLFNPEQIRINEIFTCINYARRVLNLRFPRTIDFINYSDLAKYYAWNFRKLELTILDLLKAPFFLVPVFFYHYFKHLIKSKFPFFY